jgi:carbamate kinase
MRVVVALGGNALLRRGEPMTAEHQRRNVAVAAGQLATVAKEHELVVSHGNGPQVGLLALQSAAYTAVDPYPLDVLGAETQGMIGYLLEQELGNRLPFEVPIVSILTMVEVDPADPAFDDPTKFVGPVYDEADARRVAEDHGWAVKQDGSSWRRVVPSPRPVRIFEIRPMRWLLEHGAIVICAGGGGIPTVYEKNEGRQLRGVEAVIDKDLASSLLACDLDADLFAMATDVDGVYADWGTPGQRRLERVTPDDLAGSDFAAGSMGPKVQAARDYVSVTGNRAVIGSLEQIDGMLAGTAGTSIVPGVMA